MKTTPYELLFGQPARQNIFPGVQGDMIYEEDLEDLIVDEEEEENQDYQVGTDNTSQSLKKPHEHYDFAETEASDPQQSMPIQELNFKIGITFMLSHSF